MGTSGLGGGSSGRQRLGTGRARLLSTLRTAMLGGSSVDGERDTDDDAAGAVAAPPAIDFPAEVSDPKYDESDVPAELQVLKEPLQQPTFPFLVANQLLLVSLLEHLSHVHEPNPLQHPNIVGYHTAWIEHVHVVQPQDRVPIQLPSLEVLSEQEGDRDQGGVKDNESSSSIVFAELTPEKEKPFGESEVKNENNNLVSYTANLVVRNSSESESSIELQEHRTT